MNYFTINGNIEYAVLSLLVLSQTGPPRQADCLAPPCLLISSTAFIKSTARNLTGFFATLSFCAEPKQGSCEYRFQVFDIIRQ